MAKIIIILSHVESRRTPPMGKYLRSEKYDAHIWEGRDFDTDSEKDMEQFNSIVDKAMAYYPDRIARPQVRVVDVVPPPAPSHLSIPFTSEKKRHAKMKPGFIPAIA